VRLQEGALRFLGQQASVDWYVDTPAGTIAATGLTGFTAAYSPQDRRIIATAHSGSLMFTPSQSGVRPVGVPAGTHMEWAMGSAAVALGTPVAPPAAATFAGKWTTTWGDWGQITIVVSGNRITGYYHGDGTPATAMGTFEGTVEGRVARLRWKDRGGVIWGGAMFTLSADGNTLTGHRNDWKEPDVAMWRWNAQRVTPGR
jgi:hypothetical protein